MLGQVPGRSSADSLSAGAWIRRTLELAVEDGDDSWPLLFPMTKCVIRAMDAVTEFCAEMLGAQGPAGFGGRRRGRAGVGRVARRFPG